jgi:hypothetical protein
MSPTSNPTPSSAVLMDIYKAQEDNCLFSFDLAEQDRALACLRQAYAEKLALYDEFLYICEMGQPEIVVRLGKREAAISIPRLEEIYEPLRTHLCEELRKLEQAIVLAQLVVQQTNEEQQAPNGAQVYLPHIAALCQVPTPTTQQAAL